jgi:exonuclease SbcD
MASFSFIHAADLHLDTPFSGISCIDPHAGKRMQDASLEAWDNLVRTAIDGKVEFIVLAGDIYDNSDRGVRAQLRFHNGLTRLHDAGIQSFVIYGNHDPIDGWSAIHNFPKSTKVFGDSQVEGVEVTREGQAIATVYGISYGQRVVNENLSLKFPKRTSTQGCRIALLHCTVGQCADHEPYSPCTVQDLVSLGMNYWALGHIHLRAPILQDPHCHIHYSGNLQGRSMKASEQGEKGVLLVRVENDRVARTEFLPCDVVRCQEVKLDVSKISDLPGLERALDNELTSIRKRHSAKGLLLRVLLEGRSNLSRDLRHQNVRRDLLTSVRERMVGVSPFVWLSDIRDETHIPIDVTAIRGSGDFRDILLQLSETIRKSQNIEKEFFDDALVIPSVLRPYVEELNQYDSNSAEEIWKDAIELALDLLSAEK